ncbi:hypothetical protein [Achromobacter marplatensis]|uniref:hypothetical protein n=1 Tax=Achromobacter marplatensis TaxID=470868 RepID=UPI0028E8A3A0|nr:hypothetical protein [Achromobacter marplatensis]
MATVLKYVVRDGATSEGVAREVHRLVADLESRHATVSVVPLPSSDLATGEVGYLIIGAGDVASRAPEFDRAEGLLPADLRNMTGDKLVDDLIVADILR